MSTVGSATLSFDYQSVGFDSTDEIGFLVVTNGASAPDLDVDDSSLVQLQKDTAGQWLTVPLQLVLTSPRQPWSGCEAKRWQRTTLASTMWS